MFPEFLRRPPALGLAILMLMLGEKMLAHTYTVIAIYVLPEPWAFWVPAIIGVFGVVLIIRGLGRDEVIGSLYGYLGSVLIWMSWFEPMLPRIARYNEFKRFLPEQGNKMAGLLGEHVLLQSTTLFCLAVLFFVMINKDVRCRMMLWLRKRLRLDVGKPTPAYRPNVARVAAFEYFAVTWFMYVITLMLVDPRLFGLYHPVTYVGSALITLWGLYLLYKLTQQREVGMAIRYGIGAVGVFWFVPEMAALYEVFYEFYLYSNRHPIAVTAILIGFIYLIVWVRRTPINPQTQRSV